MELYTVTGALTKDGEAHKTNNGKQVISFSLPIDKSYKDQNGEWVNKTKWLKCNWWIDSEKAAQMLIKGTIVSVEGEPMATAYLKDGAAMPTLEMRVTRLTKHGMKAAKTEQAEQTNVEQFNNQDNADDLPF